MKEKKSNLINTKVDKEKHMKKICLKLIGGFITILFAFFFSEQTMGQEFAKLNGDKSWSYNASDWCNKNVPDKYFLTQKQMSSILYLKSKYNEIIPNKFAKMDSLKREEKNLNTANDGDNARAKQFVEKIESLSDSINELRLEARIEIRKYLSPKQIMYFNDFVFSEWWQWKK